MTNSECNSMQKLLLQESQEFAQKAKKAFESPSSNIDDRKNVITDGPADSLALDNQIALELQKRSALHQERDLTAAVLDRQFLASKRLVSDLIWFDLPSIFAITRILRETKPNPISQSALVKF